MDDVIELLRSRGADAIDHPGGALLGHLVRARDLLRSWDAAPDLTVAGLAHAAYGTDGFAPSLFGLDEREVVRGSIGAPAEAIVYRYASCDRAFTLHQIGAVEEVRLRDRFTGAVETLDEGSLHELAELTFANELELVQHDEAFARAHDAALAALFRSWSECVSDAAYQTFSELLPPSDRVGP